ncbi:MAG: carboxypeptidase regulatory-like domain-containing protein, partial [Chitinophagaceae bacterium]
SLFIFMVLLAALTGQAQVRHAPVVVQGRVVDESTGQPVANAHVYIVEGEEETLTGNDGGFRIESWQKAPLTLTVNNYKQYRKTSITISNPAQRQLVRLRTKPS